MIKLSWLAVGAADIKITWFVVDPTPLANVNLNWLQFAPPAKSADVKVSWLALGPAAADVRVSWLAVQPAASDIKVSWLAIEPAKADIKVTWLAVQPESHIAADIKVTWLAVQPESHIAADVKVTWLELGATPTEAPPTPTPQDYAGNSPGVQVTPAWLRQAPQHTTTAPALRRRLRSVREKDLLLLGIF